MYASSGKRRAELVYWINEREKVRLRKEEGLPKPWSLDPVFQTTYFCNVRREDDKVTRWLRDAWLIDDKNYEFAMVLARLVNRIETLNSIDYPCELPDLSHNQQWTVIKSCILEAVNIRGKDGGPFWGNAYVVTTHGLPMDKLSYLLNVLEAAHNALPLAGVAPTCRAYHGALKKLEGFGDFMSAQVIADLKNTPFHPLAKAEDWWTFVAPGPGSRRGMRWYFGEYKIPRFEDGIEEIREDIQNEIPKICNQDLQNCLCEFDKYMRVESGEGRSKRSYPGR